MKRIVSIDGLRAISIIMVLLGHMRSTMPLEYTSNFLFDTIANAPLGVNIFFVISGYLITRLLIKETETANVNIWHFYLRRAIRIFPVFYLYIFVLLLVELGGTGLIEVEDLLPASMFLWNYKHFLFETSSGSDWYLGHFWSLSMEEQFYLIWPLTFVYFTTRNNGRNLQRCVIGILMAMPILRLATYFFMPESRGQIGMMLHTGGDAILIGCAGALIEKNTFKKDPVKILTSRWLPSVCLIFLFTVSPLLSHQFKGAYDLTLGMSFNNLAILYVLLWSIFVPSRISNILNNKILINIGILSYSLYIWQQLFLTNRTDFWINKFPQNIILVFVIAYLSYNFVEKPLLTLRKKFAIKPKEENFVWRAKLYQSST